MKKTLIIAGSNSSESINQWFSLHLSKANNYDYFDTRNLDIPMYSMDTERDNGIPKDIINLYNLIHEYDNLIMVSPEYNGYASPFLKNITDWLSRHEVKYLTNINLVIVAVVPGKKAGVSVREMLKTMLSFTNANIIDTIGIPHFDFENDYSKEYDQIKEMINK